MISYLIKPVKNYTTLDIISNLKLNLQNKATIKDHQLLIYYSKATTVFLVMF